MITWMQHNRKYLVVTIWISTIAFIGAGFVGWGQYSYGEKSGSIAKVGEESIDGKQLQKAYGQLYSQYRELFKGEFDEEQAKAFGLDKQALRQLINKALIVNLAKEYGLEVADSEVADALQKEEAFFEDGVFNKTVYQTLLKQNRISTVEYESELRDSLLIRKVLSLFDSETLPLESETLQTALGVSDKIEYKILTDQMLNLNITDEELHKYWESNKNNFMTQKAYAVEYFYQELVDSKADEVAIQKHYDSKKHNFVGDDGKLLPFEEAKELVKKAIDLKETNKEALRKYIALKKGKLDKSIQKSLRVVSASDTLFSPSTLESISELTPLQPYLKPVQDGDRYVILKLINTIEPEPKSFEDAKAEVLAQYRTKASKNAILDKANKELEGFSGTTTQEYVTRDSLNAFNSLSTAENGELLGAIFSSNDSSGIVSLRSGKVALYRIVDQKIIAQSSAETTLAVEQIKESLMSQGLIKRLNNMYETKIFVEGL